VGVRAAAAARGGGGGDGECPPLFVAAVLMCTDDGALVLELLAGEDVARRYEELARSPSQH